MEEESDVKQGMATANNTRFLRKPWEINQSELLICPSKKSLQYFPDEKWVPYIKPTFGIPTDETYKKLSKTRISS